MLYWDPIPASKGYDFQLPRIKNQWIIIGCLVSIYRLNNENDHPNNTIDYMIFVFHSLVVLFIIIYNLSKTAILRKLVEF